MLKGPYHLILLFWISSLVISEDTTTATQKLPDAPSPTPSPTTTPESPSTAPTTTELPLTTTELPTTTPSTEIPTTTSKPRTPGIYLPIFTYSDESIRPKEIGNVTTLWGNETLIHGHGCYEMSTRTPPSPKQVEWLWTKPPAAPINYMHVATPRLTCDFGPTIMGIRQPQDTVIDNPSGENCLKFVGCNVDDKHTCSDEAQESTNPNAVSKIDPFCTLNWNIPKYVMRHRWGNYDKKTRDLSTLHPDNFPETPGDLYMRQPVKDPETAAGVVAISKRFLGHLYYGPSGNAGPLSNSQKQIPSDFVCKDGCKYGQHIIIEYQKKARDIHVYVNPFCDWFTVCTNWEGNPDGRCHVNAQVNVMLRNGFVAFDSRREQSAMRLHRYDPKKGRDDSLTRVDLSILSADKIGKDNKHAYMAVTSVWRERTVGKINLGNEMMISFSHPGCLNNSIGLKAQTDDVKVPYYKFQTSTTDYKKNVDAVNENNYEVSGKPKMAEAKGEQVIEVTLASTVEEKEEVAAETTTTAPHAAEFVMPEVMAVATSEEEKPSKEGHAIWGIFYGWLIGSAAAIAIMAPIMFFMRRTMYGNWYRGMYKRYGCDASGSTGGITGAGFDETTSGMQTLADGMTTGGGGGTIGGTTTGGGTTGTGSVSQMSQMSTANTANTANTTSMITI